MSFLTASLARFILTSTMASAAPPAKTKLACTERELKAQDCHVFAGAYDLRFLKTTLAWNDGNWHTVDPLPLAGEGVEWQKVEFGIWLGRPIVQMWIWDKGVGESKVQSLHWFTADAEKRKLTLLAEGVVRKRTPRGDKEPPLYDREDPHGVRVKNKTLEWWLGAKAKAL